MDFTFALTYLTVVDKPTQRCVSATYWTGVNMTDISHKASRPADLDQTDLRPLFLLCPVGGE